ncbi:MAG TPA: hypothetical protein DCX89_09415 [Saprospirales bacterium]|nr:hypothetical protein [Saprospirales bacterium]HAY72095.1 hypothetical protein [Saprospirales bacterium]
MLIISKIKHRGEDRILLKTIHNDMNSKIIRTLSDARYSQTYRGWHIPYHQENWTEFVKTGIPYEVEIPGTTGQAGLTGDDAGKKIAEAPRPDPSEAADTNLISIRFMYQSFYVSGKFNEEQVRSLRSVHRAYWNEKYKNWVLPANVESLDVFFNKLGLISSERFERWNQQILTLEKPKKCYLYKSPEYPGKVLIQLSGTGIDVDFVKHLPDRNYDADQKFWIIPDEKPIIQRVIDHYTASKILIVNRIGQLDTARSKPSLGEYKRYFLSKTAEEIRMVAEKYMDTLIRERYSLNTLREYTSRFCQFALAMKGKDLHQLSAQEVNAWLGEIGSRKISESMINGFINAVKFYFQKVEFIPDFQIDRIKRPRKEFLLPKVLSIQQVDRMMRATGNLKHTAILYAIYGHGLRLNELLSLRLEDILWDRHQVFIRSGKGKKDRYISMSSEFKWLLTSYVHEYKPQYWLFEGQDQQSQYSENSVQAIVKRAARKAGIAQRVKPHTLRHCYATHLLDAGTQLPYIKELLGHANIQPVGLSK